MNLVQAVCMVYAGCNVHVICAMYIVYTRFVHYCCVMSVVIALLKVQDAGSQSNLFFSIELAFKQFYIEQSVNYVHYFAPVFVLYSP